MSEGWACASQYTMALVTSLLRLLLLAMPSANQREEQGWGVWWNVPSQMCHKYDLNFTQVGTSWGLQQNTGDTFVGDRLTILYDPGLFPSLSFTPPRNGGLPQRSSLDNHLAAFTADLDRLVPDKQFSGLGVIDFEDWRPVWRENWGKLDVYRKESVREEKRLHPLWTEDKLKTVAEERFEKAAYILFEETLELAKKLRPRAKWGYYGYPFCFNYTPKNNQMSCSSDVKKDNDKSRWLYESSTALFPSIYLYQKDLSEPKRAKFIEGRLTEANRISKKARYPLPVIPYATFRYPDGTNFLSKTDISNSVVLPKKLYCSGVIIWGSSKDTSSKEKCQALLDYTRDFIRPAVKKTL